MKWKIQLKLKGIRTPSLKGNFKLGKIGKVNRDVSF